MHQEGTNPTYKSSYGSWISSRVVKCILVVLVFFGLAFLVKIIVGVRAKQRCVWGHALEFALQVGPQLRKPTIGKPPPRPSRDG